MDNHRRADRQMAGWNGSCHIEGEGASGWRDCRVVDISVFGAGIRMQHLRPSELVGRRISVELPAVGESVNLRLEGEIRNAARTVLRATVRVGIEFDGLSNTERSILHALSCVRSVGWSLCPEAGRSVRGRIRAGGGSDGIPAVRPGIPGICPLTLRSSSGRGPWCRRERAGSITPRLALEAGRQESRSSRAVELIALRMTSLLRKG